MLKGSEKKGAALPELLAPAGSAAALDAAIDGGADAVYFGASAFNARMFADNFGDDALAESIRKCAAYGVKSYVTLNTLVLDREAANFLEVAERVWQLGASGIIIADLGAACEIKKHIPDIELHASTQLSGHNVEQAELLASLGFSRMVLARETSLENMRYFTEHSPIEAEVFVHGALCVSHSGQCLFSSVCGGRSGNRGECAQPCRLPYGGGYPLSLKDLCLAGHIKELCEAGVASLKIEGRMKSPEYVRSVVGVYRKLLDEGRNASADEIKYLSGVFSRGGFTDGYFVGRISSAMLGVRSESDKKRSEALEPFTGIKRRLPVELEAYFCAGEPSRLTISDGVRSVTVAGATPERAINAPLDADRIEKNLSKLGNTPLEAKRITVRTDGEIMMPISALNALRRSAVERFVGSPERAETHIRFTLPSTAERRSGETRYTARFSEPGQITERARSFFDIRFVPAENFCEGGAANIAASGVNLAANGVIIPPVIFDDEREKINELVSSAAKNGAEYALVANLGHLRLATEHGLIPIGDHRLNVFNRLTERRLSALGFESCLLSPELTLAQMRDIGGIGAAIVYGRLPLMLLEKCVIREIADCERCKRDGFVFLTDRRGVRFPVKRLGEHRNMIYNSVPIYMADREAELEKSGIFDRHFIFTDESAAEVDGIIARYERGEPPSGSIKRMQ